MYLSSRASIWIVVGDEKIEKIESLLLKPTSVAMFFCSSTLSKSELLQSSVIAEAETADRFFFASNRTELWTIMMDQSALLFSFAWKFGGTDSDDSFWILFFNDVNKIINKRMLDIEKTAKLMMCNSIKLLPTALRCPDFSRLVDKFPKVPAFIVAAGPSLTKNIDELKRVGNRALILAVDTAVPLLLSHGIEPHLIFSGDFRDKSRYLKDINIGAPLVFHMETSSKTVDAYQGPKILFPNSNAFVSWMNSFGEDKGSFETGMSVASLALNGAILLEADPIVFVGQDFAYSEGKVYADGIEAGHEGKGVDSNLCRLESLYDSSELFTKEEFYMYLRYTENRIKKFKRQFINATEGGAGIAGTENMSLRETVDSFCLSKSNIPTDLDIDRLFNVGKGKLNISDFIVSLQKRVRHAKEKAAAAAEALACAFDYADLPTADSSLINEKIQTALACMKDVWHDSELLSFIHAFVTIPLVRVKYSGCDLSDSNLNKIRQDFNADYEFMKAVRDGLMCMETNIKNIIGGV